MSFSRYTMAIIGLVVLLPSTVSAQGRDAKPGETQISIAYSRCLAPSEPTRVAMSEEDQRGVPECKKWSTPERIRIELDPSDYVTVKEGAPPALNAFLKDVLSKVYKTRAPTYNTSEIYRSFRRLGWQDVEDAKEKTGALIVWPGLAGYILRDISRPEDRVKDPLAGLVVLYPSKLRGGRLSLIDAITLHASLDKPPKPRFLLPTREKTIFWNTWVEQETGKPVNDHVLKVGKTYKVMLDLSRFDYAQETKDHIGAPDEVTMRYISELAASTHERLVFLVTPVGRGLNLVDTPLTGYRRTLKLERLTQPPSARRAPNQNISEFARLASGLEDPTDGHTGPVCVEVDAREAGCGGLAFSVWDRSMTRLIDYVVRTVTITDNSSDPLQCRPTPDIAVSFDTPRLDMLSLESYRPVDASLHVLERQTPSDTLTFLIYAQVDPPQFYSWSIPVRLSDLEGNLKDYLSHSESVLYFREVGRLIHEHFFHASNDRDQLEQADKALKALGHLAESRPEGKPSLFVRFANVTNKLVFIPIHLLTVDTKDPQPLGTQINVIQALYPPRDAWMRDNSCLNAFSFVISPTIVNGLNAAKPLDKAIEEFGFNVITSWNGFMEYVSAIQPQQKAETFLLLAHHGPNRIMFSSDQPQAPITSQTIERRFRPVSVAVLAACSVANISEANTGRQILERLNEQGIGAAIVSPFLVDETVAASLILALAKQAAKAMSGTEKITIETLFRRAIAEVTSDASLGDIERLRANEFILVGNGDINICKKEETP